MYFSWLFKFIRRLQAICYFLLDQGTLICYYSLNNPVTDARYSGQLSESSSLVA